MTTRSYSECGAIGLRHTENSMTIAVAFAAIATFANLAAITEANIDLIDRLWTR